MAKQYLPGIIRQADIARADHDAEVAACGDEALLAVAVCGAVLGLLPDGVAFGTQGQPR